MSEEKDRDKRLSEAEKEAVYERIIQNEQPEYKKRPKKQAKHWWDKLFRRKRGMMEP